MGAPVGNRNAKRAARWRDALERAESHLDGDAPGSTLFKIALGAFQEALAGDKAARDEIANRYDGKHVQGHEISGPDGGPMKGILEFVKPD